MTFGFEGSKLLKTFRLWGNSKLLLNQTFNYINFQKWPMCDLSIDHTLVTLNDLQKKQKEMTDSLNIQCQNYHEQPKLQFASAATFLWCVSWRCNFLLCHLTSVIVWVKYFVTLCFSWCDSQCTILVRLRRQIFGSFLVYFTHIKEVWIWFNKIWFN